MSSLDELRAQRYRENVGYHRSRLERFEYELEAKLDLFRTAGEELGNDAVFEPALLELARAAVDLEAALNAVRRAREALT